MPEKLTAGSRNMDSYENSRVSVHLMNTLNTMRENGEFCDLTFELNNSKFSAHQLVMLVWSAPLKNLLQLQPACTQRVRLAYDKPEVFQQFIKFLYTGVFPEQVASIPAVLLLAATFQIHLLTDLCNEHLKTSTTVDNVISMYHLAIKFKLTDLEKHCVEFVCHHVTEITQKQEIRDLTPTQINLFLGSEHIPKLEPEIKLFLIISWLSEDVRNREQFLVLLLKHIDWSMVAKDFLKEIINTDNFFTANPSSLYLLLQTLHSSSFPLGHYESHLWSLRQQYSYLLSNVVSSSVALGSGKPKHFQPLSFSLASSLNEEKIVSDQNVDSSKIMGIKNEIVQIMNLDVSETCDTASSDIKHDHICASASLNMPGLTLNSAKYVSGHKSSSQYVDGPVTEESIILEKTAIASVSATTVEGSMRRKYLRHHRIISDTVVTENRERKMYTSKKKTIVSKHYNTRKRPRSNSNVLRFVANDNVTEDLKTEDNIRSVLKKKTVAGRKGNVRNKDPRKELPGVNLLQKKKIFQPLSSMTNKPTSARNTKLDSTKKINKASVRGTNLTKNDTKLQVHKCSECEFTTRNIHALEKHQKQVHEGNCLFCCSLCSFKSKWSKEYYGHLKHSHFPGPPFYCDEDECEYSTEKLQELISHRKQHKDQRPFVCDICLTAFRSKNNLYQHFKIHSDEKKFECPECHRCFKLKNTLEQHMVTHSDLRPYLCDLCGFSTKFQSHLISHKRIHTGDVYQCNFPSCAYSTPKKSQLKSHMRSHLGIRRHVCSTCGKAFVEKSHLIRHERTHSSERAHVCTECNYSSTRADKLREHVQKHHSKEALRVKATAASSKKLNSSEKGKPKKTPKASSQCETGVDALISSPESRIEVVVLKSTTRNTRLSNATNMETVLPSILTGSFVNAKLMQALSFQPLLSQEVGASLPIVPTIENVLENGFDGTIKNEREITSAEALDRGLMADVGEAAFGYQVQRTVVEATEGVSMVSSLGNHVIMARSSVKGDKAPVTGEIASQNYQENDQNSSLTIPSYSLTMTAPNHFSKPSTQFEQVTFLSQESLHVPHSPHHLITQSNTTSSVVTQQYQHHEQHQELQHSAQFHNVEQYLY